jgi:hypothetical protein
MCHLRRRGILPRSGDVTGMKRLEALQRRVNFFYGNAAFLGIEEATR